MTKDNQVAVKRVDPNYRPEALRRLGRAAIALARWQLAGSPPPAKAKAIPKPKPTKPKRRPRG